MEQKKNEKTPPEIIGLVACPICGAPGQLLKKNKNGNLYVYCADNHCMSRYSPKASADMIAKLKQEQQKQEQKQEQKENGTDKRGDQNIGRSNGTDTAVGGKPSGSIAGRFAKWLSDDDGEL